MATRTSEKITEWWEDKHIFVELMMQTKDAAVEMTYIWLRKGYLSGDMNSIVSK